MDLPARRQRCFAPEDDYDEAHFGPVSVPLTIDPARSAFVTIDLWNMGWSDEPLDPELGRAAEYNFLGLGCRATAEAKRRVTEHLAPALHAARAVGFTIIHSNAAAVVGKYPANAYRVAEPPAEAPDWPPPEVGDEALATYFATTFGADAPARWARLLARLDFPAPVRPRPGDYCVCQQAAVDHLLRERRLTTVVYAGFLLSHCLQDNVGGLRRLGFLWRQPGYRVLVVRDATLAQEYAATVEGFRATEWWLTWLEATGVPTVTAADLIAACATENHA